MPLQFGGTDLSAMYATGEEPQQAGGQPAAAPGTGGGVGTIPNAFQQGEGAAQGGANLLGEAAGGGGQAGTAAKRLHYPGTSGGFASVGSGMGGSTLEELLKQYQG